MAGNLQVALWLRLHGGAAAASGIRKFTADATKGFGQVSASVRNAWKDLGGFSMATRLLATAGGLGVLKNVMASNLDFHKNLLEMKQTGEMSVAQMAGAKAAIMKLSGEMLQTPQEMLEGLRAFTSAGEKYEFALAAVGETARTATAFFSRPVEIANLDVDLKQKMGLRAEQLKDAHNMLLYHARSGRYETKAMAMDAPRTLNTLANVGLTGMEGVNLMGALTQRLMRMAPTTQPAEVAVYMEHLFGHLTQPGYVKGLKKAGVDIKAFMPGGKFGGLDASGNAVGGEKAVNAFLKMLDTMNKRGLQDPFKLAEAHFREQYTSKAAMESMRDVGILRSEIRQGQEGARSDLVGVSFAEIRQADFGKIKAAEIEIEKAKLGESATQGTGVAAGLAGDFADNPGKYLAGAAGLAGIGLAARMNRNRKARLGAGGLPGAGGAEGGMGGIGVQQVFVTNWPGGASLPGGNLPGTGAPGGGAPGGGAGKAGKSALGALGGGVAVAGAALSGWSIGYEVIGPAANQLVNAVTSSLTKRDETLGGWLYDKLHEPIPVKVEVEVRNGNIVATVNEANVRRGLRN